MPLTLAVKMDVNAFMLFMAKELGSLIVIGGVARVVFQPFLDNYFFNAMRRKQIEHREWLCREVFADRIAHVDEGIEMAHVNKDILTNVSDMTHDHERQLADHANAMRKVEYLTDIVARVEKSFEGIRTIVGETRDIAMRLDERAKWDGRNRRHEGADD